MTRNQILNIAIKELRYLAFSPIGWVIAAAFWAKVGSGYAILLAGLFEEASLGQDSESLTRQLFTAVSSFAVYRGIILDAYLFVPLMTMAVFAREFQSGSIKLFASSPLNPYEMVLGKYLGVFSYIFGLLLVIPVVALITIVVVPNTDILSLVPGYIGVLMLMACYAAIGVFLSSITKYQVVAAILTVMVLFLLQSAYGWAANIPVVNEITHWLSLRGRAEEFRTGVFATDDAAYYLIITAMFIVVTVIRIRFLWSRNSRQALVLSGALTILISGALAFLFTTRSFTHYVDFSRDKANSLAPESVDIATRLGGHWDIVTYANILDGFGYVAQPRNRIPDRARYARYGQLANEISFDYVTFYSFFGAGPRFVRSEETRSEADIVRTFASRVGLNPRDVPDGKDIEASLGIDLKSEGYRSFRVIRWQDREAVLRWFDDLARFPGERTRAAALKTLVDGPMHLGVLSGNGERSVFLPGLREYARRFTQSGERFSLMNHGFQIEELSPIEMHSDEPDLVLLADPRIDYSPQDVSSILEYFRAGGSGAILVEGDSSATVDVILAEFGISKGDLISDVDQDGLPEGVYLAESVGGVLDSLFGEISGSFPILVDGGVSLNISDRRPEYIYTPIIVLEETTIGYAIEGARSNGNTQRVIVIGDADVFSSASSEQRGIVANGLQVFDAFFWLSHNEYPVKLTEFDPIDTYLDLGEMGLRATRFITTGLLPLAILVVGGILILSRRSQ